MSTKSIEKVVIVIPNWNGVRDIPDCLNSLLNQSKPADIVVVDNGSTDGSIELIKSTYPNVILLEEPKNLGFAGGVNQGIKYALRNEYRCVALFNNDAVADRYWLEKLISKINENSSLGLVTGLLLNSKASHIDSTGEFYSNWGLAFPRNRGHKTKEASESGYIFGASGGASLYKTALFRDIGLFDEDFFAYYEDADISFRAQLAGWKVAYTPKAIAYHKQGATSKKIPGFTTYQTFKNLPLLFLKNVPRDLLFSVGVRFYFAYLLILLNAIVKGNGVSALKGTWMSFILGFKKLGERRQIQKNKRVSADYIKSILWDDLPPDQTGIRKFRKIFTGKD